MARDGFDADAVPYSKSDSPDISKSKAKNGLDNGVHFNAEAAERNFEDALATFGKAGDQSPVQSFFQWASAKAKTQHERLEARLRELGGSPSTAKSVLAHILAFSTTAAQIGHEPAEKNTQHLIMCVGAASAEMAMYESLATVAAAAGDSKTEQLARQLQSEEKTTTTRLGIY